MLPHLSTSGSSSTVRISLRVWSTLSSRRPRVAMVWHVSALTPGAFSNLTIHSSWLSRWSSQQPISPRAVHGGGGEQEKEEEEEEEEDEGKGRGGERKRRGRNEEKGKRKANLYL